MSDTIVFFSPTYYYLSVQNCETVLLKDRQMADIK